MPLSLINWPTVPETPEQAPSWLVFQMLFLSACYHVVTNHARRYLVAVIKASKYTNVFLTA